MKKKLLFFIISCFFALPIVHSQCSLSGVSITSVVIDPNSGTNNFDADGDGNFESDDEYIEICNTSGVVVDISGWTIGDNDETPFTFPGSTTLAPGACAVVVRDWDGLNPIPSGVFDMDNGTGFLGNGGDNIILSDGTNSCEVAYGSASCPGGATNCDDWGGDTDGCPLLANGPDCSYIPVLLPVELTDFAGKYVAGKVELTWNTSSELNNSHFVIERSLDGKVFEPLTKIQGAGTTVEAQEYSFKDETPFVLNYYRLKQVDFDGRFAYSEIITVSTTTKGSDTKVYPIPTTDALVIETIEEINAIEIFDITGRIVTRMDFDLTTRAELNVSEFVAGSYFVALQRGKGKEMIRFVKK